MAGKREEKSLETVLPGRIFLQISGPSQNQCTGSPNRARLSLAVLKKAGQRQLAHKGQRKSVAKHANCLWWRVYLVAICFLFLNQLGAVEKHVRAAAREFKGGTLFVFDFIGYQ